MRVGVIGTGRHANDALYPAILESGLQLVAVTGRDSVRATTTARRWGARAGYASVDEMLAAGGIDGVVVAVPAGAYRVIVARCIEAGLPVFCEKPAGESASDVFQLADLASASGCEVVVGYMKRFAPAYRRAYDLIHAPAFGSPTMAHFTFAMGQFPGYLEDPRHYLTDNPVHVIDLARYLVGELADISAVLSVVPDFGLSVGVVARSESGAACTFDFCTTASFAHRGEFVEVYGRGHAVQVENVDTCVQRPARGPAETWRPNYTLPVPASSAAVTMGFVPALEHFRDVVAGAVTNRSTLISAARTLSTTELLWDRLKADSSRLLPR